jgi:hypothetical protein
VATSEEKAETEMTEKGYHVDLAGLNGGWDKGKAMGNPRKIP